MTSRQEALAMLESAALESESNERIAEESFDARYAVAESEGALELVTATPEFREWMAARAQTDAAWGQWAELVHQMK